MTTNQKKPIENFTNFAKQILSQNRTKISNLNANYQILTTPDIENYFLENLDKFEIKSVELLKNRLTIAKNLTQAILKYKQENKTLLQFQDINFECQTAKIDLMKIFIEFEKYKNKNKFIDIEDIFQILFEHFTKNKKSLGELSDYTNRFEISKQITITLNKNQKQLLELLNIEVVEHKIEKFSCENLIIESKNQNSQNSFILEKISELKEKYSYELIL